MQLVESSSLACGEGAHPSVVRIEAVHARDGRQLDFSSLEGPAGWSWARGIQGIKQQQVEGLSILHVMPCHFGVRRGTDGGLLTGGLEAFVETLAVETARRFPVSVHVAHLASPVEAAPVTLEDPSLLGKVALHPFPYQSLSGTALRNEILRIVREQNISVIHFHTPAFHGINRIAEEAARLGAGAVLTHHAAPSPIIPSEAAKPALLSVRDLRRTWELLRDSAREHGLGGAAKSFAGKMFSRLRKRWGRLTEDLPLLHAELGRNWEASCMATRIATVSEAGRGDFPDLHSESLGVPFNPSFFAPARVPETRRTALREKYGLGEREVILYHARITPNKGQELLPDVAARLLTQYKRPFVFLLVGPVDDPAMLERLQHTVAARNLYGHFVIHPGVPREEVRDLLGIASAVAFPTLDEGLGGTGVEALLMEVPVVAHAVGGVVEYVRNGETGILVPLQDTEGMASGLAALLNDPDLRREMGRRGRALAAQKYLDSRVVQDYMERVYCPEMLRMRASARATK